MRISPKCSGEIPSFCTTGSRIGVKISTAGVMSMNVPTTRSSRLMMSSSSTLSSVMARSPAVTAWGMLARDITHDIPIEVPINSSTTAVVRAESVRMAGSSRHGTSR